MFRFKRFLSLALLFTILLGFASGTQATVLPNSLFTDGMVLQRNVAVPVWGTAADGEVVTIQFAGQTVSTTAQDGKWMARLAPLTASDQPANLTIRGKNTVTINNVIVGEVWVCGGQSNMERQLGPRPPQPLIDNWEQEAASANFPNIREFYVPEKGFASPPTDVKGHWTVCTPQTAPNMTAVGFFFARALYAKINVPIGLILSAVGGTPVESWTSKEALLTKPEGQEAFRAYDKLLQEYPTKLADFQQRLPALMQKYQDDVAKTQAANRPPPSKPGLPAIPPKTIFPASSSTP